MRLYHYTLARNLDRIAVEGLRVVHSRGALPRVWLCDRPRLAWALTHVSTHHGVSIHQLALLQVDVPSTWLTRPRRGVYCCLRDIPPPRIGLAGS